MIIQNDLLLKFFQSGGDSDEFSNINPVKSLEEIQQAKELWIKDGDKFKVMSSPLEHIRGLYGVQYLQIVWQKFQEGRYNPKSEKLIGTTEPLRRITLYVADVNKGNIYRIDSNQDS